MRDGTGLKIDETEIAERITVRGLVQGVGFRPTVWRIAREFGICGSIVNNGNGVEINAQSSTINIDNFVSSMKREAPPLSRIDEIKRIRTEPIKYAHEFLILDSEKTAVQTGIVPDAAICEGCAAETLDPFARRFRYPFTNCTHCGPRLSIIENIPYDRETTVMREFEMCDECRSEYENPVDRRFHAQPIACFKCGPKAWLKRSDGKSLAVEAFTMLDDVDAACTLIQRGKIIAIKGLGGFQLACDATNHEAVSRLRELKHRERKPFALMVRDLAVARRFCEISETEKDALESPASPIVILDRSERGDPPNERPVEESAIRFQTSSSDVLVEISDYVAPGMKTFGVMLPNTPLHHLLLKRMPRPIVLTSGNLSDEPQCTENGEAIEQLGGIAEYLLTHDRPIAQRIDDSVVKIYGAEVRVLRRARGYAPSTISLPKGFSSAPRVLAFGSELKNTFCLGRNGEAILSQHIGDLEDSLTQADYRHNLELYKRLFGHSPEALVCDLHPEYISSKLARKEFERTRLPLIKTQHHHAHITSCLAENNVPLNAAPVIGVALDGIGFGDDGTLWGGEFLLADYENYSRLATFRPVEMLGGEKAVSEPWRNTYAHLVAEMGWAKFAMNYRDLELFKFLESKPREVLDGMLKQKVNSPLASSCGRLFDAAAAAVGICRENASYEGQGAIEFEAVVDEETLHDEDELLAYPFSIPRLRGSNLPYIEPLGMWQALLGDLILKTPRGVISARFHKGLAKVIVEMIKKLSKYESGDEEVKTIALSGGVWQNKVLFEQVNARLGAEEFTVLTHRNLPPNDGGLSLGQVAIASARLIKNSKGD